MAVIKGMGSVQLDTAYLEQQRRKKNEEEEGRSKSSLNSSNVNKSSPVRNQKEEEERTARLAVLYEQEALVSGYLEDANARRQFEDALALKASLEELWVVLSIRAPTSVRPQTTGLRDQILTSDSSLSVVGTRYRGCWNRSKRLQATWSRLAMARLAPRIHNVVGSVPTGMQH